MTEPGGEPTRLDLLEKDISDIRARLANLEKEFEEAKTERSSMKNQMTSMNDKMDRVVQFVEGTDKLWGFCRKHWRDALKFGAGIVTAYGVTNPSVQRMLQFGTKFFGL